MNITVDTMLDRISDNLSFEQGLSPEVADQVVLALDTDGLIDYEIAKELYGE